MIPYRNYFEISEINTELFIVIALTMIIVGMQGKIGSFDMTKLGIYLLILSLTYIIIKKFI